MRMNLLNRLSLMPQENWIEIFLRWNATFFLGGFKGLLQFPP